MYSSEGTGLYPFTLLISTTISVNSNKSVFGQYGPSIILIWLTQSTICGKFKNCYNNSLLLNNKIIRYIYPLNKKFSNIEWSADNQSPKCKLQTWNNILFWVMQASRNFRGHTLMPTFSSLMMKYLIFVFKYRGGPLPSRNLFYLFIPLWAFGSSKKPHHKGGAY